MHIIAGLYKNRILKVPKQGTRPTLGALREALFNICQQQVEGAFFLDLCAGSGAIGLEALSRGATQVTFVENGKEAVHILRANIAHLGVEAQSIICSQNMRRALQILEKKGMQFDLIYLDPPYGEGLSEEVIHFLDHSSLLKPGGMLFIEESRRTPPALTPTHLVLLSERSVGRSLLQQWKNSG